MGYLDNINSALQSQKSKLQGSLAQNAKALLNPERDENGQIITDANGNIVPKTNLTAAAPSGINIDGSSIPGVETCSPDYDAITAASKETTTLQTTPPQVTVVTTTVTTVTPAKPKLPTEKEIKEKLINKLPMDVRQTIKVMTPPPTIAQIMAMIGSLYPLPTMPAMPQITVPVLPKTFCKPPSEAPATAKLLPEVKTETKVTTTIDEKGNKTEVTETVTTTTTPMDTAGVNDKAQVKILGEIERQKFVKNFIAELKSSDMTTNIANLKTAYTAENNFWQKYSVMSNCPQTPLDPLSATTAITQWTAILNEYKAIYTNIENIMNKINIFFYTTFKNIFYMYPEHTKYQVNLKMIEDGENASQKIGTAREYLMNFPYNCKTLSRNIYDLAPPYLSKDADFIYNELYLYFDAYVKYAKWTEDEFNKGAFAIGYDDIFDRYAMLFEMFNSCKTQIWDLPEEKSFEKFAIKKAKQNAETYKTETIVKNSLFSYYRTGTCAPFITNDKYNFESSRIDFSGLYLEALINNYIEGAQKTLPPQG